MKPTGLLGTELIETPFERSRREAKNAFIDDWVKENPEIVLDLKKLSKEQLVGRLIATLVGNAYDTAVAEFTTEDDDLAMLEEAKRFLALCKRQPKCTPEEKKLAIDQWETRMIAIAGKNTTRVAEIAGAAGAARVFVRELHKIDAFKERSENLKIGRDRGAQKQKTYAAETWRIVATMNADLLKHANTARHDLDQRAKYIEKKLQDLNIRQLNGKPYLASTIKTKITGKG